MQTETLLELARLVKALYEEDDLYIAADRGADLADAVIHYFEEK